MSIRLQMIGTGAAFAKTYYNNNALVSGGDFTLLLDCGTTAPRALHQLGVTLDRIDGIFITHLHADHIGGLEEIALQSRYYWKRKPKLFLPEELVQPIWNHSLRAGLEFNLEGTLSIDDFFEVVPLQPEATTPISPTLTLEAMKTKHFPGMPSYSVFLGSSVFYSGDVVFDRALLDYVLLDRKCKQVLHDCELSNFNLLHATLDELLTLPDAMQAQIRLMHYGDDMANYIGKTGKMTFLREGEEIALPNNHSTV